eukprot:Blabericola_migrator_1__8609@NODE_450_length_8372_cov_59_228898_g352_i0_p5_GENE_NODE_450_length_8372_cov_59_228898_g352_i0NODE_450_length_8372_cov_59_228898_g352_i0_p5_ORF_typecomplete_len126_score8_34_NODE_450_length_8372_cov_59_228898_g352_i087464
MGSLLLSPAPPWWVKTVTANALRRMSALWAWNNEGTDPWPYVRWIGGPWSRAFEEIVGQRPFPVPLTKYYLQTGRLWDKPNPRDLWMPDVKLPFWPYWGDYDFLNAPFDLDDLDEYWSSLRAEFD